ncbi:MAG: exonuclease [Rhodobacteraceae bacterium]|nr:exonuclease [Paracoccaceae bacterium]MAY44876.1 exonuclease [Paracoccaceae bacterium]
MAHVIVYDCEFLTAPGAPQRFWCGPTDPDPVIAQIGAAKLSLERGFPITETIRLHVIPRDRHGARCTLDPLFSRLTGITDATLSASGQTLGDALAQLDGFSQGATLWSWGKDEFNMIAISCYVAGIEPVIPVDRFGNACNLLLKAGMALDDIHQTRSNTLAARFGIDHPPVQDHDGLDDALGVAWTLQHLLREGRLSPADFG